jgi:uncharacterized membrane protein (DUF2068 family)
MHAHVKVLGVVYIVLGSLGVLLTALFSSVLLGVLTTAASPAVDTDAAAGATFLHIAVLMLTLAMLTLSLPGIICGWGLLRFKSWARIVGIVLAAIEIVFPPVFTIIGAYGLWVLLSRETEALFAAAASPSN